MNLGKCYFDIEGTSGSQLTCDVLSLSFINTDQNDKVLETKTYLVRPRKSRIYQVDALMINKFDPFDAENHKYSSFTFTRELNKKFIEIGNKGSFFATWSGHSYDYMAVSHHLFTNLFTWPWIFSTGNARQLDVLPIARNLDYFEPNKIATELNEKNNKVFKLESFCRLQGFPISDAHTSLDDTKGLMNATLHLQKKFPQLFKESLKNTNKHSVLPSIKDKNVFIFPESFYSKTRNFAGCFIGEHKFYAGYYIVADLKHDWQKICEKKGKDFDEFIKATPKKIRNIKSNRNPLIRDKNILKSMTDEFSELYNKIGLSTLEKRGDYIIKNREDISRRIDLIIQTEMEEKKLDQTKKGPEELIFGLNPTRDEKNMMEKFVQKNTAMEEQIKIIKSFKKPQLKYLGEIVLFEEYGQEAFTQKDYKNLRKKIAQRLLSTNTEKFPTIPEQLARIDSLRVEIEEDGGDSEKLKRVENINKHLEKTVKEHEKYL